MTQIYMIYADLNSLRRAGMPVLPYLAPSIQVTVTLEVTVTLGENRSHSY